MSEGVDYSEGMPGGAALRAANKSFAVRYLWDGGKGITASEYQDLVAHGIEVAAVFESWGDQRQFSGGAQGIADAQFSQNKLREANMPPSMPVYFATDWDIQDSEMGPIDEYLRGAATVLGANRVGLYGGFSIIDHCNAVGSARWFWQTLAWEYGRGVHPAVHIYQYDTGEAPHVPTYISGVNVDLNRSLQENYGQASLFLNGALLSTPTIPSIPVTAGSYILVRPVPGYVTAADAAAGRNSNSTAPAGTLFIFNESQGMVNVTAQAGQPGWWINPADNAA